MNRPGQKNSMAVVTIAATQIEERIYKVLREKGQMQNNVLEMYKQTIAENIV